MPHARTPRLSPRPLKFAIALAALLLVASATARAADCASPVFSLPQTYGVGAGPAAVASGDFNGDGIQDIAVPNNTSHDVSVLLGDGAGGFGPPTNFAVPQYPRSIAVADFNKDGKADLVVGYGPGGGGVALLFGDGTGRFSTPTNINTNGSPRVVVGDFNGDTNPDIAAGLFLGFPRVLLGDGAGNFTTKQFSVGDDSSFVAVGRFNSDNIDDLVFAVDDIPDELVIVLGTSDGNFAAGTRISLDQSPLAMLARDFNGDGRDDLAVTVQHFEPRLHIILNDGSGGFGPTNFLVVAQSPQGLTSADFNNDGKADLAVGNGSAQILLGNGAGWFAIDSERYLTGGGVMLAGDFNGDGKADIVSPRGDIGIRPSVVSVILGKGDGKFDVSRAHRFNVGASALAVADFNGDGRSDVTSTFSFSPSVGFSLGTGDGGLWHDVFYDVPGSGGWVATGDFDGDGKSDVAASSAGTGFGKVTVFYGDGAGTVARTASLNANALFLAAGNFNGDARSDLVTMNGDGRVSILLSNGPSGFDVAPGSPFNLPTGSTSIAIGAVAVGDFNGDGRDDLATTTHEQSIVSIFLNDGAGRMTQSSTATVPIGPFFHEKRLAVGDFNRDGRLDLVSSNSDVLNVTVFLGDGAGGLGMGTNFAATERNFASPRARFMAVADFDGDANPDLAVSNGDFAFGGDLSLLFGDGAGGFGAPFTQPIGASPWVLAAGNFNADAKPDLAIIGLASNAITILQNVHEPLPCLSVGDVTLTEGDSGSQNAVFNVTLSQASADTVRVNYSLKGVTATEGSDYAAASGRLVFAPGETSKAVSVAVAGDPFDEADETFELTLAGASRAGLADAVALGTIKDNDPTPTLAVEDVIVTEGGPGGLGFNTPAVFRIFLSAPSGRDVTVRYATTPGTAAPSSPSGGLGDYQASSFTATIPAGQTSVNVTVFVTRDITYEADENFFLDLSEPVNATIADPRGQCNIIDDDSAPTLSVDFAAASEGDSGQTPMTVTLRLSNPTSFPVSVNYSTADGTAVAPADYAASSGTVSFGPEAETATFTVMLNGDTVDELNESVFINFSNPVNVTLPAGLQATGFIADDDGPAVSVEDVSVTEGNSGTTDLVFTVSLSAPSVQAVRVTFLTANGTAAFNQDYQPRSGFLNIPAGSTSGAILVRVVGDTNVEPDETFTLNLSDPVNGTIADAQGVGTILDDDDAYVQLSSQSYAAGEGDGKVSVTVTRTGNTAGALAVDYATSPGSASERSDYTTALGTIRFAAGETQKTVPVLLTDDAFAEGAEALTFTLSNPAGGKLRAPFSAAALVNDNDAADGPSPVRDDALNASFFVRQHYLDFLNREPDASGLAHWTNQMTNCGNPNLEVCRVNVSAAFFLSIEFQQTGYFVYRLHQAAFGTGERLPFDTFLRDAQDVGRDVVVGPEGWELKLEANRQAFADAFAARAAFAAQYPAGLTPEQFVDALNANTLDPRQPGAGGSLTQAERDQLVADLRSAAKTRAQVLRAVADNAEFQRRQSSKAFVLMQYFGYLRRAPNSLPDSDFTGYNFWLGKLNDFGGNYIQAEMVKAFITSTEYRNRFGQP